MNKILLAIKKGYYVNENLEIVNKKGNLCKGYIANGYRCFTVRDGNKCIKILFHRFIAYKIYGDRVFDKKLHVRHINGIRSDNSAHNIRLGTISENMMDKPKEVRMRCAMHATSFVRKYDRQAVKVYWKQFGFKKAMEHFGIKSKGTMSFIING